MAIGIGDILDRFKGYTYEDYINLPDDGKRYEIIDGELYLLPTPNLPHQSILGNLFCMIAGFLKEKEYGEIFLSPLDVVFSNINIIQPDLIFVAKENFNIIRPENIRGTPDLLIEILSTKTEKRDRTIKLKTYSKFGVQEYWMVHEEKETVEVWRRKDDQLNFHSLLDRTQTLTTPLLPGLEISLEKIFQE
jgi:Uma2 family endonuclease